MIDPVSVELSEATESSVRVTLSPSAGAESVGDWELYGPRCDYARTLPSTFRGRRVDGGKIEFLVTEPCYWTSELPFLYELSIETSDGKRALETVVGFRRLSPRRQSLYQNSRRIVLRGTAVEAPITAKLEEARRAEVALLVRSPSEEECRLADRLGVDILADLRYGEPGMEYFSMLANHPSIAAIIVDENQVLPCVAERMPRGGLLALAVYSDGSFRDGQAIPNWCRVLVADLHAGERPPSWMSACGRPVVAIQRGDAYATMEEARAACDLLQAELAPEFDLAGYFVGAEEE
jgi:hypothetical protein